MHPQVREHVMDRLGKEKPIHFGTWQTGDQQSLQKATVRGTDMTLVATSGPKELDVVETMSVLNNVIMPRTRELQRLGIVKDFVVSESTGGRQHRQALVLREERGWCDQPL